MRKPNLREEGEGEGGDIKAAISLCRFCLAKQRSEATVRAKSCWIRSSHRARNVKRAYTWWGANEGNAVAVEDIARKTAGKPVTSQGCKSQKSHEAQKSHGRASLCAVSGCHGRKEARKMWIVGHVSGSSVAVRVSWREASKLLQQARGEGLRVGKQKPGGEHRKGSSGKAEEQRGQGKTLRFWATSSFTLLGPREQSAHGRAPLWVCALQLSVAVISKCPTARCELIHVPSAHKGGNLSLNDNNKKGEAFS